MVCVYSKKYPPSPPISLKICHTVDDLNLLSKLCYEYSAVYVSSKFSRFSRIVSKEKYPPPFPSKSLRYPCRLSQPGYPIYIFRVKMYRVPGPGPSTGGRRPFFSKKEIAGRTLYFEKNKGAVTFFRKKNRGAKTFFEKN